MRRLVKRVGAGTPVGEEHAEADRLEDAGESTNGNGVEGTLLGEDLGDDRWSSRGEDCAMLALPTSGHTKKR